MIVFIHLVAGRSLLLPPSIFLNIIVFYNELVVIYPEEEKLHRSFGVRLKVRLALAKDLPVLYSLPSLVTFTNPSSKSVHQQRSSMASVNTSLLVLLLSSWWRSWLRNTSAFFMRYERNEGHIVPNRTPKKPQTISK